VQEMVEEGTITDRTGQSEIQTIPQSWMEEMQRRKT